MKFLNLRLLAISIAIFGAAETFPSQSFSVKNEKKLVNLTSAQRQKLREKTKDLYQEFQDQITQLQDSFIEVVENKLDELKDYSKKNTKELFVFFDEQVEGVEDQSVGIVGFRVWVQENRDHMIEKYYGILEEIDPDFSYNSELSTYERSFIQGLHAIANQSLVLAQALILDLSSDLKKQRLSFELEQGFFESELHAQMMYEEQLRKNEAKANKGWWDDLKQFGADFCDEFKARAKVAIGKEVSKQISQLGTKIKEKKSTSTINPAVADKIDNLSEKLEKEGIEYLQENKLTDAAMVLLRKSIRSQDGVIIPTSEVNVKASLDLCPQERIYLKNRMAKVQQILQKEFDIDAPLRISMCCSGGGNRAMIGTLGFFTAAAKHNILQATTYIVGLSGSTWTIAPWVYLYSKGLLGSNDYLKSLESLKNNFIATLSGESMLDPFGKDAYLPPVLQGETQTIFARQLMDRFGYEQNISLVDVWGSLIGNYALNQSKQPSKLQARWSEIAGTVVNGALPFALCSAAFDARQDVFDSAQKDVGSEYDWFETSPFEAGSTILGYVPIQYFGSPFSQGKLVKELVCPEYPMSFYLGVYGSAFSLTINDLVEKGLKNPTVDVLGIPTTVPVASWVKSLLQESTSAQTTSKRHSKIHAQLYNFAQGQAKAALQNKYIGLFDGGIAFNFPLPLVIDRKERAVDVVFIYDSNPGDFNSLKSADKYFARKGIKLPSFAQGLRKADLIDGEFPMRVYNDPRLKKTYNADQPTFIYFPTKVDVGNPPYVTTNFKYTSDTVKDLTNRVIENFEYHLEDIKEIMKEVAQSRNSKATTGAKAIQATDSNSSEKLKNSGSTIKDTNKKFKDTVSIDGVKGEIGEYNVSDRTAYLVDKQGIKRKYYDVVEHKHIATPKGDPYIRFATMPNRKFDPASKKLADSQIKNIVLYGKLEQ